MTDTILIIFNDGERKVVDGVASWGIQDDSDVFYFIKHGRQTFLPVSGVRVFTTVFDWETSN